ncbi:cytochrome P450 [Streptomyces sp. NPDC049577]|uniref:cytochrome P450 n=1 Tax=Streptomyces sp. NPDC049577 TaxID=3155153 RepID=UPI0034309AA2
MRSRTSTSVPVVPGAWPVVGHAPQLMRRPLEFVTSLAAHGDVVRLGLGMLPVHAVTHPSLVRRVLVDDARHFSRGRLFEKASLFLGEGLAAISGPVHRRHRRVIQPAFHPQRIAAGVPAMREAAQGLAAAWRPGQTVAVDRAMNDLSLDVLARTLLPTAAESGAGGEFHRALPVLTRGMMTRSVLPEWWTRVPTPGQRRFDRAHRTMDAFIGEAIGAAIGAHGAGGRGDGPEGGGMLSVLLADRHEPVRPAAPSPCAAAAAAGCTGGGLTERQIRDHVTSIVMAGVETTGATLAWFFHELGRHPEVEARVHAEVDAVLGDRPPGQEDLPALEFTGRALTETLRRYTPWLLTRRADVPVLLGGFTLPAGAEILYSPYALHHDARWFPSPRRFDPDRWLPERAREVPKGAFMPFGAGAHKCIGETFAFTEMMIAAAVVCRRWRLRPVPGVRVRAVARGEIHPDRLPMTAEPRHGA